MKVLITGATGFVGSWLMMEYPPLDICACKKFRSDTSNIREDLLNRIDWVDMDITDAHSVNEAIIKVQPDVIHHLAAQSYVPASWNSPTKTFEVNVLGTINLFEAVRMFKKDCVIHIASSSEIYGIPDRVPIDEKVLPCPCSPYGVSKLAMDRLAVQYHLSYGLKTVITRGFNHTGPRRNERFVCSSFAKQIVEIEKGKRDKLLVGNLRAVRDFTDVRDMCKAYKLAIGLCRYGEPYNVCSEKGATIGQVLTKLIDLAKVKIVIEEDKSRLRPSDLQQLIGNCKKFKNMTGWKPEIPLEKTLLDLLNFWRDKV